MGDDDSTAGASREERDTGTLGDALANHPRFGPVDLLRRLARQQADAPDETTLRGWAEADDPVVRRAAAGHRPLPADVAEALAADPDVEVRRAVAASGNHMSADVVGTLAADTDPVVASRLAEHAPTLPGQVQEALLTRDDCGPEMVAALRTRDDLTEKVAVWVWASDG